MKVEPKVLRRDAVLAQLGIGRSTLYKWVADQTFPRPIKLGGKTVGWLTSDVDAWLNKCVQARDEVHHG